MPTCGRTLFFIRQLSPFLKNENHFTITNALHKISPGQPTAEAIILAGGLGTRLRSAVPDLPKCMAEVAGRPFISYVIANLLKQGIERFIFSLGYMHDVIENYISSHYPALHVQYAVEETPLGTGGAVKLACKKASGEMVLVLNGDTFFDMPVRTLQDFHKRTGAECTLSLKPMNDFDRYGVVELKADQSIKSFHEKRWFASGLINAGFYALNAQTFLKENSPEKFSFEKDYLEKKYASRKMFGFVADQYFIDIGIPEDYKKAQEEMKQFGGK